MQDDRVAESRMGFPGHRPDADIMFPDDLVVDQRQVIGRRHDRDANGIGVHEIVVGDSCDAEVFGAIQGCTIPARIVAQEIMVEDEVVFHDEPRSLGRFPHVDAVAGSVFNVVLGDQDVGNLTGMNPVSPPCLSAVRVGDDVVRDLDVPHGALVGSHEDADGHLVDLEVGKDHVAHVAAEGSAANAGSIGGQRRASLNVQVFDFQIFDLVANQESYVDLRRQLDLGFVASGTGDNQATFLFNQDALVLGLVRL